MKILYDHQIFASQIYGGISRYFLELMKQFSQTGKPEFELSLAYSKNHYLNEAGSGNRNFFFKNSGFWIRFRSKKVVNTSKSKKAISKQQFDVFHPTYYDPYFLSCLGNKPFVLTIHDMINERFAVQYFAKDKTAENKKILARKAGKIIAISENTKSDILRYLPDVDEKKIAVIHLANSLTKCNVSRPNFPVPSRYILFVGPRRKYKNFLFLLNSMKPVLTEDRDLHIVCAGGKPFKSSEMEIFTNLGVEKQLHQFSVADSELAWLYQNAIAFVFPSLYEGFGIPVLESFACGCPVVCSNTSSLPEVGGEAAAYFDPASEISIKNAVTKVIYDSNVRKNLIDMGLRRIKNFSWQKTAEETAKIYRSIL